MTCFKSLPAFALLALLIPACSSEEAPTPDLLMSELEGTEIYDFCGDASEAIALNLNIKFHFRCLTKTIQVLSTDAESTPLDGDACYALYSTCMEEQQSDSEEFLQICPTVQWSQCDHPMSSTQSCIVEVFAGHVAETPDITCYTLAGTPHNETWGTLQGDGGGDNPDLSDECAEIKSTCLETSEGE